MVDVMQITMNRKTSRRQSYHNMFFHDSS